MSTEKDPETEKQVVRTRTPRPDELTAETLEFLTEIDRFKRDRMQSFLSDEEILSLLLELGYRGVEGEVAVDDGQIGRFVEARQAFRKETGRLFPSWSEVFAILRELGYARPEEAA